MKPNWVLGYFLVVTVLNVIGFLLVVEWGLIAVAAVFTFVRYILAPIYLSLVRRCIKLNYKTYLSQFLTPIISTGIMSIIIILLKIYLSDWTNDVAALLTYIIVGAIAYLSVAYLYSPDIITQVAGYVRSNRRK